MGSRQRREMIRIALHRSVSHLMLLVGLATFCGAGAAGIPGGSDIAGERVMMELTIVPAGTFEQGDGIAHCGVDQRPVTLTGDLLLGRYEITNQQYVEMLQWALDEGLIAVAEEVVWDVLDGGDARLLSMDREYCEIQFADGVFYLREAPAAEAQGAYPNGYDPAPHPVKSVSWCGAAAFCDWVNLQRGLPRTYDHLTWDCNGGDPYGADGYRLPTDAEWEFAAQYNDERTYPWGDDAPRCDLANYWEDPDGCIGWSTPVGSYAPQPAELGLFDMGGNAWEFCNDWWSCELGTEPAIDPAGPESGDDRVAHGGPWYYDPGHCRCANRHYVQSMFCTRGHGFRVARSARFGAVDEPLPSAVPPKLLLSCGPNPFGRETRIAYRLPERGEVCLSVLDPSGRLVRTLARGACSSGTHSVVWNGTDHHGRRVAPGLYFVRIDAQGRREAARLIVAH